MLFLRRPDEADKGALAEFVAEFRAAGEDHMYGSSGMATMPFAEWLAVCRGDEQEESVRPGRVPSTQYLCVRQGDGRIVGCVALRHRLNEGLLQKGGHIGYAIRPGERRKGYGAEQLRLTLERCAEMGIARALVTCDAGNLGSAGVMLKNGGAEDESFTEESGQVVRRFWFDT
ncbi:MAG: GNAT family N-acetyltransferase [Clostridiales bacterium]|nr:GNAT family N-acetyltransferase [Clostridiales bacterium]